MNDDLRNCILTAEIFSPGMYNLGMPLDLLLLRVDGLRSWDDEAVLEELKRMEAEGLVKQEHGAWSSTFEGQVARERFVQSVGGRAACLRDQHLHELDDLMLAIVVTPQLNGNVSHAEDEDVMRVYLYPRADECRKVAESLVGHGHARVVDYRNIRGTKAYYPTSKGMRHYENVVRERLGLAKYNSILDAIEGSTADLSFVPSSAPAEANRFMNYAKLGEGAYGDVWRAWDTKLKRDVAVKFVRTTAAADLGALGHARALARVQHPNIVTVHDVLEVVDPISKLLVQAVVMELVEGPTLAQQLGRVLEPEQARRIGTAILDAIGAYHARGLAHSDLHEGNIIVGDAQVKVLDPLYFDTVWMASTASRQSQQAKDVRNIRDLLSQILNFCPISPDIVFEFMRDTGGVAIDKLRATFLAALSGLPQDT